MIIKGDNDQIHRQMKYYLGLRRNIQLLLFIFVLKTGVLFAYAVGLWAVTSSRGRKC